MAELIVPDREDVGKPGRLLLAPVDHADDFGGNRIDIDDDVANQAAA